MNQQRSKKKLIIRLTAAIIFIGLAVWIGFFIKNTFFPTYEPFTVNQQRELSSPKYGTYVYRGTADQTEYDGKIKRKALGITQTGDRIVELKDDPEHHYFILIFNTEMPWWDLYEKE
ncbi:hypothetical protein C2I18_21225 [Paenibacillus sp. PK3_47]|uniref:hypothetical protein n=1 Tax=Paenibacillus sp. PK3_47 TaxID=2072642 RepID=UPI00201DEF7A|nr:hypothetical protein [Paenibacillus sp. PK3_47]UQZ35828.1 hypothetical protein C2I18_21225 [Paenibacillus sp. PK3_47]